MMQICIYAILFLAIIQLVSSTAVPAAEAASVRQRDSHRLTSQVKHDTPWSTIDGASSARTLRRRSVDDGGPLSLSPSDKRIILVAKWVKQGDPGISDCRAICSAVGSPVYISYNLNTFPRLPHAQKLHIEWVG